MSEVKTVAIYPGSFDPFTVGHLDVLTKASKLFDEVIVLVSVNYEKNNRRFNIEESVKSIKETILQKELKNVKVEAYMGLVAEYAKSHSAGYIIRGLRNVTDYNYEENIALINKKLSPDVETVYFRAEDAAVSSSMVMELYSLGLDILAYIPEPVYRMIMLKSK